MTKKKFLASPGVKKILPYVLVWVIACCLGLYLRLYTLFQHTPFASSERATMLVLSNVRKSVVDTVTKKYPNLSVDEKNVLIKRTLDNILNTEGPNIQKAIGKVAGEVGGEPSEITTGPYLLASDGYYYYSLTKNIVETGRLGPAKGSKYFNNLMLSPLGHWEPLNLHPYVGYWIYSFLKIFDPHINLMYAVSFTPLVMLVLILIPFLILCYLLECRPFPSLVASILFVTASIFLKRSMFAWYDDDSYSVFFPLIIFCLIFYGLRFRRDRKK